jgi:hypothetical protein
VTSRSFVLAAVLVVAGTASTAFAESPERAAVELAIGPYEPNGNRTQFDQFFAGDRGPVFSLDTTFYLYQIPYFGPIGIRASAGWARYAGNACFDTGCTEVSTEDVTYHLLPLAVMASLRFDALQHHWRTPLFLEGDIGLEYVRFRSSRGGVRDTYGGELGLRWQAQVGLYLDVFEPRAARALDENQGINHTYLFFQIRGSQAKGVFPVADRFTWLGGLGLVF